MIQNLRYLFEATFGEVFPKATTIKSDIISKVQQSPEYINKLRKEYENSSNSSNSSNSNPSRRTLLNINLKPQSIDNQINNYFENVDDKSDIYTNKITKLPTSRKIPMRNLYKDIISKEYSAKVQGRNLENDASLLFPNIIKHNINDINYTRQQNERGIQ